MGTAGNRVGKIGKVSVIFYFEANRVWCDRDKQRGVSCFE